MKRGMSRRHLLQRTGGVGLATMALGTRQRFGGPEVAGAQDTASFQGVKLTAALIGGGSYEKLYTKLDDWQAKTGATIDTSTRLAHGELNDKLLQEYASGNPSFNWASDHTIFWPQWEIALEPLTGYFDQADLADFTPSVLDACKSLATGDVVLIPRHVDIQLMYYRTDLFGDPKEQADFKAKYGYDLTPPADWTQVGDVAEFFTRPPDLFGFVAAGGGDFETLLVSAGGTLLDEKNRPAWNSEAGKAALNYMVSLYGVRNSVPEGSLTYGWDDVTQLFRTGKVALYHEWPGWYEQLKDPAQSSVVGKFDVAKIPAGPAGSAAMRTLAGSHGFAVAKDSDNHEASADAIKWITTPEAEVFEFTEGGFLPVRTSVWEQVRTLVADQGDALDKKRLDLLQQSIAENFWTYPTQAVPAYLSVQSETLSPLVQQALLGEVGVDEALAQSAQLAEEQLTDLGAIKD
jgi:multiple sugar transport system substrate-binding protein